MKKFIKIIQAIILFIVIAISYILINNIPLILASENDSVFISKVTETVKAASQVIMDENEFYCHWHGHPPGNTSYKDVNSVKRIKDKNKNLTTGWYDGTPPNITPKCDEKNYYQETTQRRISHGQSKSWSTLDGEQGVKTGSKISLLNEKGKFTGLKGRGYAIEYMLTSVGKDYDGYEYGWNEKDRTFHNNRLQGSLKQQAVWKTDGLTKNWESDLVDDSKTSAATKLKKAKKLIQESYGYAAYYEKYKKNNYKVGKSLESSNARVCFNYDTNQTIVGPFKVKYLTNIDYDDKTFAGITNMYLRGIDPTTYQEITVPISSFIEYGDYNYTPRYFKPKVKDYYEDSSLVDTGDQYYPDSGEYFYVVVNNTNVEHFTGLNIEFGALEARSTIYFFRGFKFDVSLSTAVRSKNVGTKKKPKYKYQRYVTAVHVSTKLDQNSQYLFKTEGVREIKYDTLSCTLPQFEYNLQGNVWLDNASVDGIKQGNEPWKNGVEVYLLDESNNIVTTNSMGQALKNPVVTGTNGYYEFKNLSFKKRYKLRYIYDGQLYEATYYTGLNYDPNTLHSNSTEKRAERNAFNSYFFENGAQGIYVVSRARYIAAGQYNKAWLLEKKSSESPYGINELYNELLNVSYTYQNYNTAFNYLLSKYSGDANIKSKLQYLEDCRITAYLGNNTDGDSNATYPAFRQIVLDSSNKTIANVVYHAVLGTQNIAFGITPREKYDVALTKDVASVSTEINGKQHTYTYGRNANVFDWDIVNRRNKGYYNQKYSRELFMADYGYKVSMYGNTRYSKTVDNSELRVYVTYKLSVKNQSPRLVSEIMELVDYFDNDYTYIDGRSYIMYNNTRYPVGYAGGSKYGGYGQRTINGYTSMYITGLQGKKLNPNAQADIYLTFEVKKTTSNGEKWLILDENLYNRQPIGVGKENICEINGVKSYYANGVVVPNMGTKGPNDVAGILDTDSLPGNLLNTTTITKDVTPDYSKFEDDTDKAPDLRLIIYPDGTTSQDPIRRLDGIVWEDLRTKQSSSATVGDGLKQGNEPAINGVTVQLVELMGGNNEIIWTTFSSGQNYINGNDVYIPTTNIAVNSAGQLKQIVNNQNVPAGYKLLVANVKDTAQGRYIFRNYPAGNYVIRFIYGDTVKTTIPKSGTIAGKISGGQNEKSYNGHDYKSTSYQVGITQKNANDIFNNNEKATFTYDIVNSNAKSNVSDAKDSLNRRTQVINYSKSNVINRLAEILASHEKLPTIESELQAKVSELINNTYMIAQTGAIDIQVEYNRNTTTNHRVNNKTDYYIKDVNLGLEERPRAQLMITKEVTNVRVVLADGSTLFDSNSKAMNVLWNDHKPHNVEYDTLKKLKGQSIKQQKSNDAQYGLVQLSMDSELMLGARIKISYKITVSNVGEVDYNEKSFYYTGNVANRNTIVKTYPNKLLDYVVNNLQFSTRDNPGWEVIEKNQVAGTLVNSKYTNEINKYNTIIQTSNNSKITGTSVNGLVPKIFVDAGYGGKYQVSDDLVLTQLISPESETDDLTYPNTVEIVMTSNDVGRRNAYSIVGNQNPNQDSNNRAIVTEIDTDRAEIIQILPPFGNSGRSYIVAAIIGITGIILIAGIILIQKNILKVELPSIKDDKKTKKTKIKQVKRQPKR